MNPARTKLPCNVDAVAFNERVGEVVVAGYELVDGGAQSRRGGLWAARVGAGVALEAEAHAELDNAAAQLDAWVPTAHVASDEWGVFDARWNPASFTLLAAARSDGVVSVVAPSLETLVELKPNHPHDAVLSVGWSPDERLVVGSLRSGLAAVWDVSSGQALRTWQAHSLPGIGGAEVWTASFFPDSFMLSGCVATGGDDGALRVWDVRLPSDAGAVWVAKDPHAGSGVCTVEFDAACDARFVSGGYDERLVEWDARSRRRVRVSEKLGGGVWRARFRPGSATGDVAVACMRGGFRVLRPITGASGHCSFVDAAAFAPAQPWEALAYGLDWCGRFLCGGSFYDSTVWLWDPVSAPFPAGALYGGGGGGGGGTATPPNTTLDLFSNTKGVGDDSDSDIMYTS